MLSSSGPQSMSETEAVRLAQQGHAAGFDFLYRQHSRRVYCVRLRMVRNVAHAEDLTQDIFLAVFRGIRQFRGESAFGTWLYQIARNMILMTFRKKRVKEIPLEEILQEKFPGEPGVLDLQIEGLADRLALQAAVNRLSEKYRATLLMHDVHGYQHQEVSKRLGCSVGTSKSQLHKARLRLRKALRVYLHGRKNESAKFRQHRPHGQN